MASRGRAVMSGRHCERSEAIHSSSFCCGYGLLRGACHRARIRATRWLAMTVLQIGTLKLKRDFART
jgi:hypothetical protein